MNDKIPGSQIRPGNVLEAEGKIWRVLSTVHVKPGKGGAFTKAKVQSLGRGHVIKDIQFSCNADVYLVQTEDIRATYLYTQDNVCHFMDTEYSTRQVPIDLVGDTINLVEADTSGFVLCVCNDEIVTVTFPIKLECTIHETTPPGSGSSTKHALSNGIRLIVPTHVSTGDRVVIDSRDKSFVEKVKK